MMTMMMQQRFLQKCLSRRTVVSLPFSTSTIFVAERDDSRRLDVPVQVVAAGLSSPMKRYMATSTASTTNYETLSDPAPGSPFHYAFPVHSLEEAKHFYGTILGCQEGRSSDKWQDYALNGHQIVCHWAGDDYRCVDYYNPVDGDEVPVPHVGLALTVHEFHALADRLHSHGVAFIIEPHLRFEGQPGEQYTMFFKDPSGNNLEFKAMTTPENLFAKYNVPPE